MALTESNMLKLESELPEFSLPDVDGSIVSSGDYAGKPLLIMFMLQSLPLRQTCRTGINSARQRLPRQRYQYGGDSK